MELAKETLKGLAHFGSLKEDAFKAIVTSAFAVACGNDEKQVFDSIEAKQAYASTISLILEAAKHNAIATELKSTLDDSGVPEARATTILKFYEKSSADVRKQLSLVSINFAAIVDVSWRLDYYVKSDILEQVRQPVYFITLKTKRADGSLEDVQFTANFQELQDILSKVKDAIKQIERIQLAD